MMEAVHCVLVYSVCSTCEWVLHKWLMHNPKRHLGKFHIAHHRETKDDMTLGMVTDDPYVMDCDWRGTGFSWRMTLRIFPIVVTLGFFSECFLSRAATCFLTVLFAYTVIIWNAVHPAMHGMAQPPLWYGPSVPIAVPHALRRFLVRYHRAHHASKGTRNFNITLPGADWMFGTLFKFDIPNIEKTR